MKTAYTATEPMGKCGICGEAIEPKRKFVTPIEALGYTEFMHETCFEARVESDVLQAERENTEWMQNYLRIRYWRCVGIQVRQLNNSQKPNRIATAQI